MARLYEPLSTASVGVQSTPACHRKGESELKAFFDRLSIVDTYDAHWWFRSAATLYERFDGDPEGLLRQANCVALHAARLVRGADLPGIADTVSTPFWIRLMHDRVASLAGMKWVSTTRYSRQPKPSVTSKSTSKFARTAGRSKRSGTCSARSTASSHIASRNPSGWSVSTGTAAAGTTSHRYSRTISDRTIGRLVY